MGKMIIRKRIKKNTIMNRKRRRLPDVLGLKGLRKENSHNLKAHIFTSLISINYLKKLCRPLHH
jgi:hypothetical protein